VRNDWTQAEDLAAKNPAKLKELQALFWKEAKKYQVLPLDTSVVGRLITPRPSLTAGRNVFTCDATDHGYTQRRRAERPQRLVHVQG